MNRRKFFRSLAVAAASAFAANYLPVPKREVVTFKGIPVICADPLSFTPRTRYGHPDFTDHIEDLKDSARELNLEHMAKALKRIHQSEGRMVTYQRRD